LADKGEGIINQKGNNENIQHIDETDGQDLIPHVIEKVSDGAKNIGHSNLRLFVSFCTYAL
jgi:hypothetical protein